MKPDAKDVAAARPASPVERWIPGVALVRGYRREWLVPDLMAGIATCVLSIPMSIACSGLIGVEPHRGLFAAIVGLLAFSLLTKSRFVVVGPDTSVAIVVASAIGATAGGDPARAPALAATVALLSGAIMIAMGLARVGAVADFLSRPVLVGFMNGAALIVIFNQLGRLLGLTLSSRSFLDAVAEIHDRFGEVRWNVAGAGLCTVVVVTVLGRLFPRGPWALAVFVAGILGSVAFDLESRGFAVVGRIEGAFDPGFPRVGLADVATLLPGSLAVALLTFPEAILLARAFAPDGRAEVAPNRELFALGVANVLSGASSSFSIAASSTRTSLSHAVGARSQVAHLFAAGFLVASLGFLKPLIEGLPVAAIAAILVYAGLRIINVAAIATLWRLSWKSATIAVLTTAGVLLIGIIPGILAGVLMSLVLVMHKVSRPPDAVLRRVPGRKGMHDVGDEEEGDAVPGLLAYRVYAPLIFSNAGWVCERIRSLIDATQPAVRCVLLDAQAVSDIDVTAADDLRSLLAELRSRGIAFVIANANRPLREKLGRYHLASQFGGERLNRSVNSALKEFLGEGP